ncbi:thiamine phosphate synthase [Pararhizobium haloflavum]|uniref:thiamine phosphate synthase n=1 Tax=Pararhizobium haloflavum TaxID=2037914 RepID=UPI000C17B584|nr:thiamine phosphate synthase [Pararhizobium haloflavum]
MADHDDRCRLVLVTPRDGDIETQAAALDAALRGGDVATLIIPQYDRDDREFQALCERLVAIGQQHEAAVMIAGDSRVTGRSKADGQHVEEGRDAARDAIEKFSPRLIVGIGNIKDRHAALEIGEMRPDYVFFGKLNGDIKPEAHPKVLALAEWWASMVEIPCITMGGASIESALEVAETGAEFVAMHRAVFDNPIGPAQAVAEINALLAEKAPRFHT